MTPITDGIVPLQPTPSVTQPPPPPPPPPPPVPPVISKSSTRSDILEQRQHQDLSRSTDSINDQQWHMVSSNRGLRKGSTTTPSRRETIDESQTINKTNKTTSNNPGKNVSYIYIYIMICVVPRFVFHIYCVCIY